METVKHYGITSIKIGLCLTGLVTTFYSVIDLMYFLSDPNTHYQQHAPSRDAWVSASLSLFYDMCLLSLFVVQHSVLALPKVKQVFSKYGFEVIYRSLYVIMTALALQEMIRHWHFIPEVVFWKVNTNYRPFWWLHTSIHVVAWIIIYTGNICMDVNELLGIKQVYYSLMNLPDPNLRKSHQLLRLNTHMRHPSFLAFLLIFWVVPVMTLDRFLLAGILSTYMYLAWNTDERDYAYQRAQYERKFHELERLVS